METIQRSLVESIKSRLTQLEAKRESFGVHCVAA